MSIFVFRLLVKNIEGYADTIVWSPFGDENMGYKNFLCVESRKVIPHTLKPQESRVGKMDLIASLN